MDLEFQKRGNLWNGIHPGVHETILSYLDAAENPTVKFEYQGTLAQQLTFCHGDISGSNQEAHGLPQEMAHTAMRIFWGRAW